jgi:hypothetical protein
MKSVRGQVGLPLRHRPPHEQRLVTADLHAGVVLNRLDPGDLGEGHPRCIEMVTASSESSVGVQASDGTSAVPSAESATADSPHRCGNRSSAMARRSALTGLSR